MRISLPFANKQLPAKSILPLPRHFPAVRARERVNDRKGHIWYTPISRNCVPVEAHRTIGKRVRTDRRTDEHGESRTVSNQREVFAVGWVVWSVSITARPTAMIAFVERYLTACCIELRSAFHLFPFHRAVTFVRLADWSLASQSTRLVRRRVLAGRLCDCDEQRALSNSILERSHAKSRITSLIWLQFCC